jgi:succinate dehydrogenase / fumarate reductase flavoprotein subunit
VTIGDYLAGNKLGKVTTDAPEFRQAEADVKARLGKLMAGKGTRTVDSFHRALGKIMWDKCGMARERNGLEQAIGEIQSLREEFWACVNVPGSATELNQALEKAARVADFFELGELMCRDALHRDESCGGHFRVEYQTEDGEALRDDSRYCYVAAWEWQGEHAPQRLHREPLVFEHVQLATRSYK